MIELMKKRTKQKLKKLFKKIFIWVGWLYIPLSLLCNSLYSFISLHKGASVRDVESHRYAPVLSELLLITVAAIFLLFALKFIAKLKIVYVIAIGLVLFGLIGVFGYWAFNFTRQEPGEGLLTLLIMIGSILLFTVMVLWYESCARSKRIGSKEAGKKK